jgi:hypothetical protein
LSASGHGAVVLNGAEAADRAGAYSAMNAPEACSMHSACSTVSLST